MTDELDAIRGLIEGPQCRVDEPLLRQIIRSLEKTGVGRQPAEAIAAAIKDKYGVGGTADADALATYAGSLVSLLRATRRNRD